MAGLVHQLQRAGVATIVIDVEGEYTEMDLPAADQQMLTALQRRDLAPAGTRHLRILHLIGRETSREVHGATVKPFCLQFADLSPYAVMEILDLSPAQQERFLKAYDTLKLVLRDLEIFPKPGEDNLAFEVDELESGYPRMTLLQLIDMAGVFADMAASSREDKGKSKSGDSEEAARTLELRSPELRGKERVHPAACGNRSGAGSDGELARAVGETVAHPAPADLRQPQGAKARPCQPGAAGECVGGRPLRHRLAGGE